MVFEKAAAWSETQTAIFWISAWFAKSITYVDNRYSTRAKIDGIPI